MTRTRNLQSSATLAFATLLGVSVLGAATNNILNVPLRQIALDFHAGVATAVLVISSFVITLAAGITLSGWAGERLGRRRILLISLTVMALAMVGAALAPSLPFLIAMRAVQGLACATYPPAVMALLAASPGSASGARSMGAWAAANSVGQAVGPPGGGYLADAFGWRSIFWVLAPTAVLVLAGVWRWVPTDAGRVTPLHRQGAVAVTLGAALVMTAVSVSPAHVVAGWVAALLGVAGLTLLVAFVRTSATAPHPLIRPASIVEGRFLGNAVAAAVQMFCLSATLVAVPLYLTGELGRSVGVTGVIMLCLPAAMVTLAPVVGRIGELISPRRVLRLGLLVLAAGEISLGCFVAGGDSASAVLAVLLGVVGLGMALVQTPSAAGVAASPVGRSGAALGLFNMLRFCGAALGAAWVALIYPRHEPGVLFGAGAAMAMVGLVVSLLLGRYPNAAVTR